MASVKIGYYGPQTWIENGDDWLHIGQELTAESLQSMVKSAFPVEFQACRLNATGRFEITAEEAKVLNGFPGTVYEGLAPFYDVRMSIPGCRHKERITVWLPLEWNGRFISFGGAGNRTDNGFGFDLPNSRVGSLPISIRNGFVGAITDGGVEQPMVTDWALDHETGEWDDELFENFNHMSSHRLAIVVKDLIEAVYGMRPEYSYFQGASGGGRQAMEEAQRYPEDFDGIWADCPAINWNHFMLADLWPPVVCNTLGVTLGSAKLEAFRKLAIRQCGGMEKFKKLIHYPEIQASDAIGKKTIEGVITKEDAEAMQMIWDGPRTSDGRFIWYGMRPGSESWELPGASLLYQDDGELVPFPLGIMYVGQWIKRDYSWDWKSITTEDFEQLQEEALKMFPDVGAEKTDLSEFRDSGHKLFLTVGVNDPLIMADGTIHYYEKVCDEMGGKDKVQTFFKTFVFPATGHGMISEDAPSMTMADGMAALMRWVEDREDPRVIRTCAMDSDSYEITEEGTVEAF